MTFLIKKCKKQSVVNNLDIDFFLETSYNENNIQDILCNIANDLCKFYF